MALLWLSTAGLTSLAPKDAKGLRDDFLLGHLMWTGRMPIRSRQNRLILSGGSLMGLALK